MKLREMTEFNDTLPDPSTPHYKMELVSSDPSLETSVRGLQKLQLAALEAYHNEKRRLDSLINNIRGKRHTKLKTYDDEPYYEPGRSRMPTPSGRMGGE